MKIIYAIDRVPGESLSRTRIEIFDHPQIESLLKQLKARSMVIVYQILRHSLLRYVSQGEEKRQCHGARSLGSFCSAGYARV
jgi:hypothetical protein